MCLACGVLETSIPNHLSQAEFVYLLSRGVRRCHCPEMRFMSLYLLCVRSFDSHELLSWIPEHFFEHGVCRWSPPQVSGGAMCRVASSRPPDHHSGWQEGSRGHHAEIHRLRQRLSSVWSPKRDGKSMRVTTKTCEPRKDKVIVPLE